jgi:signal transduction histidine kinase
VNLLSNAFGHNPPGTTVAISAAADGPGHVVVTVADDGAGLPAELAAAPFEPARRRRTATSGAGLGLSISRGIVAAHGGQIELTAVRAGTCFRIRLPVEALAEQATEASRLARALPEPQPGQLEIGVAPGA